MTFSEFCQSRHNVELLDWQKQFLDEYYSIFLERREKGEPMIINVPRGSAKTSFDINLLNHLIGYLDYLERGKNDDREK